MDAMAVQVVLVHGIRTSATMWRAQVAHLRRRGTPVTAVDLPGHGTRRDEAFTLDGAFATIDAAVQDAATRGPVLLVGHSMGGLLSIEYVGAEPRPPVAGFVAASCTSLPHGIGRCVRVFSTHCWRWRSQRSRHRPDRLGPWLACGVFPDLHDRRCSAPLPLARHIPYSLKRKTVDVANIKSQIKRNKTNEKARERNKAVKSELRTHVRRTKEAVVAGDKEAALKALATATKKLDKAVSKGVIHQNQAANRKSAIAKSVAAL